MSIYPFDQTGTAISNRVTNERHVISAVSGTNNNYIVPRNAPFFKDSVAIYDVANDTFLDEGTDFECTHHFSAGDDALARKVYGSITFLDTNRTGEYVFQYQTLGGDFVTAITQAIDNGIAALNDLQTADWADLVGIPPEFPVTAHTQPVTDILGVQQIIDSVIRMEETFKQPVTGLALEDISDLDTEFVTPLLTSLNDVAAAIRGNMLANIPYEQWSESTSGNNLGPQTDGSWFDTGAVIKIPATGSYKVDWNGSEFAIVSNTIRVQYRFLVNGALNSSSHLKGSIKAFQKDTLISLQARVVGGDVSSFYTESNSSPLVLTAFRIGI